MTDDRVGLKLCPNPWCASGTPPLPAALRRGGWRVICACGVQTFRQETEAEAITAWNQRVDPSIESLQAEVEDLKHDLDRYMKIANIECNEAEDLRHILRAARPYISDRAGIGIIGAIDQALAAKEQTR